MHQIFWFSEQNGPSVLAVTQPSPPLTLYCRSLAPAPYMPTNRSNGARRICMPHHSTSFSMRTCSRTSPWAGRQQRRTSDPIRYLGLLVWRSIVANSGASGKGLASWAGSVSQSRVWIGWRYRLRSPQEAFMHDPAGNAYIIMLVPSSHRRSDGAVFDLGSAEEP